MSTAPEEPGDARALTEAAEHAALNAGALAEQIAGLRADLATERKRGRRNTLGLVFMALGLLLDVVLTVSLVVVSMEQYVTASEQARTRVRVLCPLYEVLLAAAANPSPESQSSPTAKARFDAAVKTIRNGYTTLGCLPPLPDVTPSGTASTH